MRRWNSFYRELAYRRWQMRVLKNVKIKFMGKKVSCTALFDTGSGYTVVQRVFFVRSNAAALSLIPTMLFRRG